MALSKWATERGERVLVVSAVLTSVATILTLLRIYARAFIVKQMGADDWTVIAALTFSWAFFGLFVAEVDYGMGQHMAILPTPILLTQLKCFWATIPIYNTALILSKLSVLLQYLRIFPTKRMRIVCYCMIAFISIYGTWTILSAWLNCIPVSKFWDKNVDGYCLSKKGLWFSNSAIHILTDIMIIIYPMPALKSLQLPRRQKIAVMCIFSLGGCVFIMTILRLRSLLVVANSKDPTYDNVGAASWSAVECNVAIMCASLPGTRAFITKLFPRFFSSDRHYYPYPSIQGGRNIPLSHRANNANFRTSIGGGESGPEDYHGMDKLGYHAAIHGSNVSSSLNGKEDAHQGIQVTTAIYSTEDSASHVEDDGSSMRHLV